jgi:hypothetical protein
MSLFRTALEGYDLKHVCKTPGAMYASKLHADEITISVKAPKGISFSTKNAKEAEDLEAELHYAIENVLSRFFDKN